MTVLFWKEGSFYSYIIVKFKRYSPYINSLYERLFVTDFKMALLLDRKK